MCDRPIIGVWCLNSNNKKVLKPNYGLAKLFYSFGYSFDQLRERCLVSGDEFGVGSCGKCQSCRLAHSREWALRIMHEAQMHNDSCFLSMTFDNEHLPAGGSISKRDVQLFMKSLRDRLDRGFVWQGSDGVSHRCEGVKVKYYAVGEYGEKHARPHYHICLFGFSFPDRVFFKRENGHDIFISGLLSELWPYGFSTVGDLEYDSAAYVARYCMKKLSGGREEAFWDFETSLEGIDPYTGYPVQLEPVFSLMSKRLSYEWWNKYSSDVYPEGAVTVLRKKKGKVKVLKLKPPRYYAKRFELEDISGFTRWKESSLLKARKLGFVTFVALEAKRRAKSKDLLKLKRSIEV